MTDTSPDASPFTDEPDVNYETDTTADQTGSDALPPGAGRLIGLLVSAAFVVILNETIMSVAISRLMDQFAVSAATAQWLSTGFMLTMAVVIPFTGWLLNSLRLRTVFILAMSTFTLGTAIAALAPVFGVLVAGRVVQAVGTAIMMPLLMTTVLNVVPAARRGRVMGLVSIVIAVAPAAGPTVGGVILEHLSWRWMFGVVLPIALIALGAGVLWVRNVTEPRPVPLDALSGVFSAIGFAGLIYGLSSIGEAAGDTAPVSPWIPLTVGVLALAVFTRRQLRLRDAALLDLRVLARPTYTIALATMLLAMLSLFGTIILLPMYFQQVLGWSTQQAGLALLPGGLVMAVLGYAVGNVYDRVGPRPLLVPGSVLGAAGMWGYTFLNEDSSAALVIALHITLTTGLSMMFSPLMTTALSALPRSLYAHGSALMSTLQQVAGAAGTALFITLLTVGAATALGDGAGVGGTGEGGAPAAETVRSATMSGVHLAMLSGACLFTLTLVAVWFVRRPQGEPS
ncbi:DHA2 family lincomycin resistance protein-like MFS transporter [Micrococcus cohnii]|uniref:DHA2 family lincomycin resistance protein-like MFS transporter n=1 Tax=Micrococcus cohnii TaxID=993416 RepID=A0A7W7M474_9MICC|nr:MDR family MFS transporter [Micrococcus cohnii]MBB4736426.1 DHA2 family lincomycin resistance protein-like MFS transporter [Micrococcus cohnii]